MRVCAIISLFIMSKISGYNLATLGNLFYELNQKYAKVQKELKAIKNTTYLLQKKIRKLEKRNKNLDAGKNYRDEMRNIKNEVEALKITVDELSQSLTQIREEIETIKNLLKNQKTASNMLPTGKGIVIGMAIMTFLFLIVLEKRSQKEKEEREKLEEIEKKLQTVSEINRRQKIAEVFYLREKGFTTQEIAKRLGIGKGEVELILSLGKKKK